METKATRWLVGHRHIDLDQQPWPGGGAMTTLPHDPGGRVRLVPPAGVVGDAVFGGDRREYRYRLSRTWADGPRVLFVMMNPSIADPRVDDPTVAKCVRFARRWGFGGLDVGNAFAYRATDQGRLAEAGDPVGPDNDRHLLGMVGAATRVVLAYGKPRHPALRARGPEVARMLAAVAEPHVLALSVDGTPRHPLYLPETLTPVPWPLGPWRRAALRPSASVYHSIVIARTTLMRDCR